MGRYIEGPAKGKVNHIVDMGATVISEDGARQIMESGDEDNGVIIVVDNGPFEAAAWAFDLREFKVFTNPRDHRPKTFLTMNRETIMKVAK